MAESIGVADFSIRMEDKGRLLTMESRDEMVNMRDWLHNACISNNPNLVQYLVSLGADVNCKDVDDVTPLLISTANGNMGMTKCLIDRGANINARDKNQKSCLHYASNSNNTDLVRYLVRELEVDVNCKDVYDITPLLLTIGRGNMAMTKCLINLGAEVNARNKSQWNCLHYASNSNNTDLVQYLVRELEVDVNGKDVNDTTSLLLSIGRGNMAMTKCLINLGADVNAEDKNQRNCLHAASQSNNTDLVQYLVSQGVDDVNCKDVNDTTPLLMSLAKGDMDMTKFLINLGADLNARNRRQQNCIHCASESNNPDLVQYLVRAFDVDVNSKAVNNITPLLMTTAKGDMNMTKFLIYLDADVNAIDKNQRNCLHFASQSTNPALVQYLVRVLGVDVNCKDDKDITPLMISVAKGNMDMTKCLIGLGADVNARNKDQSNCLHAASQSNNPDLVQYLVSQGVDVNDKDVNDITPLLISSANGNKDMTKCLIGLGADVKARTKKRQWNCLHYASKSNSTDLVQYLVNHHADVNSKTIHDIAPIFISIFKGHMDVTKCLIGLGADVNARDKNLLNCIHYAAIVNNCDLVQYLVKRHVDVNCKDVEGFTPLLFSTRQGNMNMTKYLIGHGAEINARDKDQRNCLHAAIQSRNPKLLQYLISLDIDVNCKDKNHQTPVHFSIGLGDMDMTKCLICVDADVNAIDKDQWNCLHFASQSNNPDMVKYLGSLGVDVNSQTGKGLTPFHMSLSFKDDETVSAFIDLMRETMCRTMFSTGSTNKLDLSAGGVDHPLLFCAKLGYTFGARLILDSGADVSKTLKNSCLDWSCKYGHLDIVRLLLLTRDEPNLTSSGHVLLAFGEFPFSSVIDYSNIIPFGGIHSLHIPESTTLESLLRTPGIGNVLKIPKKYAARVHKEVSDFLSSFFYSAVGKSSQLKMCGSVAEGAKVGLPNEMDVLYIIDKHSDIFEGKKVKQISNGYIEFSAPGMKFDHRAGSFHFHKTLSDQWLRATETSCSRRNGPVLLTDFGCAVSPIKKMNRKACTPLLLTWLNESNTLCISVDIVPSVHIQNWSTKFISSTWLMENSELRKKGYIAVPKPPHRKSKVGGEFNEKQFNESWQASFSHLEAEHIKELDDRVRNVYVAAKCLRNPDVCRIMITEGKGLPKNVDDYITSYMLKSMFLKNVEDFQDPAHPQSLEEMVCKVYDDLDDALHDGFIPTFFMPTVNVLGGLKLNVTNSAKVARIMKIFVKSFCTEGKQNVTQGTYYVYDITNDQWTSLTLNMRRSSYFSIWLVRSASWLLGRLSLLSQWLLGRLFRWQLQ